MVFEAFCFDLRLPRGFCTKEGPWALVGGAGEHRSTVVVCKVLQATMHNHVRTVSTRYTVQKMFTEIESKVFFSLDKGFFRNFSLNLASELNACTSVSGLRLHTPSKLGTTRQRE